MITSLITGLISRNLHEEYMAEIIYQPNYLRRHLVQAIECGDFFTKEASTLYDLYQNKMSPIEKRFVEIWSLTIISNFM